MRSLGAARLWKAALCRARDALFPNGAVCIACGALRVDMAAHGLCRACEDALTPLAGPLCPRCGASGWAMECPDCAMRAPGALDARRSAYPYRSTAGALVRALKYQCVEPAAQALADGMRAAMPEGRFDALVPVPLHKRRMRLRGFNQADALCRALCEPTGLPVLIALCRARPTKTQTRLDAAARRENVRAAFVVSARVAGASLLLVDDVLTTGATAESCAQALKAAGAASVVLLTAARADLGSDA